MKNTFFLKPIILTLILIVIIGLSQGKNTETLVSPLSNKRISILSKIRIKLEQNGNEYNLNKHTSIIPQAGAASTYDNASAYAVLDFDSG